jgi:uncharacterized membrane protein
MASSDVDLTAVAFRLATERRRWRREDRLLGAAFALVAGVVLVDMAGLETGLVRPVVVVPFLSLLPGYLLLGLFGVRARDATTGVLYSLGLSLCFLMGYGLLLNTALPGLGVEAVFTESVLFWAVFVGIGALLVAYVRRTDPQEVDLSGVVDAVWRPWPLALLCVPFFAVLGARLVTRSGDNGLVLAVLAGLGVLAAVAYLGVLPKRYFPLAIWVIAVSLLLHNSVLTHHLQWDVGKEWRLARTVVENGVWDPGVGGGWMKNAMLRIVLLHPIYALLADIDLLWEFKTVGPILFAFAPVALYKAYQAIVDRSNAFIAALLPMSLFVFFTVLSVNSRTNGALLFLSLIAVVMTDRTLQRRKRRALTLVFLFGLIVSHYATAYLVLVAMGLVLAGNWVLFGVRHTTKRRLVTPFVVFLFGLLAFAWYAVVTYQGGAFARLITELYTFLFDLWRDFFGTERVVSGEESTTARYATTTYTSNTIRWLRYVNFVLGALAGASVAALGLRRLWTRFRDGPLGKGGDTGTARTEYLLLAAAFLGVFGATFFGIDQLNTGRTLMPALFVFAPFVVLTVRGTGDLLSDRLDLSMVRRASKVAVLVFILSYFVLNVGLYGSVTGEYHPNILIDKERVIEEGSLAEKDYFWSIYATIHDLRAEEWLDNTGRDDDAYYRYGSRKVLGGLYNCTALRRQPVVRQGSCDDEPARAVDRMDKVYATTGSHIFYNSSTDQR